MVTIREIAKIAGTSHATVSMAINNKKGPSEEVRKKILKIVKETGYVPNVGARNLVMKKNDTVGIFLLNFPEKREDRMFYYYGELLQEIMIEMKEKGYNLMFYTDKDKTKEFVSYSNICREQNLRTAIFLGMNSEDPNIESLKELKKTQIILFDIEAQSENYNCIISDSKTGIEEMLKEFKDSGKKTLAVIKGKINTRIATEDKIKNLEKISKKLGLEIDYFPGDFYKKSGYEVGKIISPDEYDSVFAMNDAMAIGVHEAFKERGISTNVIGFDNLAITEYIAPNISSIAHNNIEIIKNIFQIMEKNESNKKVFVPTEFKKRT
ncbi:MAG: LacI family DNA-binding transcriptional regulator [Fusobacteriaceae bacterium]